MKVIADTLRGLACEMIHKANSGHTGICLGFADVVTALVSEISFDSKNCDWLNRDRVIFSCGHGSALWYAVLYGFGVLNKNDLDNFRQLHSKTPGHLELSEGVDITTGPLGQGFAWACGMALAERILHTKNAAINHYTYVLCSDGDLMEGLSYEAAQVAGHLKLEKLIVLFDDNEITIDGSASATRSENMQQRFQAQNWEYINIDGHDINAVKNALKKAKNSNKPTVIACKTQIGKFSQFAGDAKIHGKPLNAQELKNLKENIQYDEAEFFKFFDALKEKNHKNYNKWKCKFNEFDNKLKSNRLQLLQTQELQELLSDNNATRVHSQNILKQLVQENENIVVASADLSSSCGVAISNKFIKSDNYDGNFIKFGVCEHAMVAVMGGLTLHGGLIGITSTFLTFYDYAKPAIRLCAMMNVPLIMIATHDSIALGEDGPTHQPIEHLDAFRAVPNLLVARPADGFETFYCYEEFIKHNMPMMLILTRQKTTNIHASYIKAQDLYFQNKNKNQLIVATGSESFLGKEIAKELKCDFISMPIAKKMENECQVLVIESGRCMCWGYYFKNVEVVNIETFGESGKCDRLLEYFGYTKQAIMSKIKR